MQFAEEAILQGQGDYGGGAQDVVGLAHAGTPPHFTLMH